MDFDEMAVRISLERYEILVDTQARVDVLKNLLCSGDSIGAARILRILGFVSEANKLAEEEEKRREDRLKNILKNRIRTDYANRI